MFIQNASETSSASPAKYILESNTSYQFAPVLAQTTKRPSAMLDCCMSAYLAAVLLTSLLFGCAGTDKEKSKPAKTSTFATPAAPSMPLTATPKPWLGLAETSQPGTVVSLSQGAQYKRMMQGQGKCKPNTAS